MFWRLRGRLDQLQGEANFTMSMAQNLVREALEDLEDIMDGVGLEVYVDKGAAAEVVKIVSGAGGLLPLKVTINPEVDTYPHEISEFVGGPHDAKTYRIDEERRKKKTITLPANDPDDPKAIAVYVWDGLVYQYDGDGKPGGILGLFTHKPGES